jgi:hypothetical protein
MYWTDPATQRRRGRWPVVLLGVLLLLAAVTIAALILGHKKPAPKGAQAAGGQGQNSAWSDIRYVQFENYTLPVSTGHGPKEPTDVVGAGYSHDTEGAVLAGSNTFVRVISTDQEVARKTVEQQTVSGSITQADFLAQLGKSTSTGPTTINPDQQRAVIGYLLKSSAGADDVTMTLLIRATGIDLQADARALVTQDVRVRWVSGDWKTVLQANQGGQVTSAPSGTVALPGQTLTTYP